VPGKARGIRCPRSCTTHEARLADAGIEARGEVGDAEPLQAIEDALRTFGADEIIISTHPEGRSHWLEKGVVTGARERFAVPITHVVVDLEAESEVCDWVEARRVGAVAFNDHLPAADSHMAASKAEASAASRRPSHCGPTA
jgi:hypothetical protein